MAEAVGVFGESAFEDADVLVHQVSDQIAGVGGRRFVVKVEQVVLRVEPEADGQVAGINLVDAVDHRQDGRLNDGGLGGVAGVVKGCVARSGRYGQGELAQYAVTGQFCRAGGLGCGNFPVGCATKGFFRRAGGRPLRYPVGLLPRPFGRVDVVVRSVPAHDRSVEAGGGQVEVDGPQWVVFRHAVPGAQLAVATGGVGRLQLVAEDAEVFGGAGDSRQGQAGRALGGVQRTLGGRGEQPSVEEVLINRVDPFVGKVRLWRRDRLPLLSENRHCTQRPRQ